MGRWGWKNRQYLIFVAIAILMLLVLYLATMGIVLNSCSEVGTISLIVNSLITKLTFSLTSKFVKFIFEINGLN